MNSVNNIDRLDEVLRLIYFDQVRNMNAEQLQQELYKVLESNHETVSSVKEQVIISGLTALMRQPTFGQLIERVMTEQNIGEELLTEKTGLGQRLINELRKDCIYPNNIPIQVFKKLVLALELPYNLIKSTVLKTYEQLKHQALLNDATAHGFAPTFRKGYEQLNSGAVNADNDNDGNELFENEEALNKYLNRLEELMTNKNE